MMTVTVYATYEEAQQIEEGQAVSVHAENNDGLLQLSVPLDWIINYECNYGISCYIHTIWVQKKG